MDYAKSHRSSLKRFLNVPIKDMHLDTSEQFVVDYIKSNSNIIDSEGNSILMNIVKSPNIYVSKLIMKHIDVA